MQIAQLEERIAQIERELREVVSQSPACQLLLSIPGVGLLTATALVAAVGTDLTQFRNGRQLAAWLGLTPRERSSGSTQHHAGGRPLPAHAAHARRAQRAAGCSASSSRRPRLQGTESVGCGPAAAHQPEQGYLCAGQQTGAHLLRHAALQAAIRRAARLQGRDRIALTTRLPLLPCQGLIAPHGLQGRTPGSADADNRFGSLQAARTFGAASYHAEPMTARAHAAHTRCRIYDRRRFSQASKVIRTL